jgi:N-acetylmuramoyl-L-alanine amidase
MRFVIQIILHFFFSICLCAQIPSETTRVKPNPGEGVIAFLKRHNLSTETHLESFKTLNQGKFSRDGGLLSHHSYELPRDEVKWIVPIFGKDFEELKQTDDDLKGAVFYLVSGHGGPDPGAIGHYGQQLLYEDEYAYDITLRLARNLLLKGAKVHIIVKDTDDGIRKGQFLTPDTDETVMDQTIPLNQIHRLKQRTDAINQMSGNETATYQRCIEIHLDSRSQKKQLDVFYYYHEGSNIGKQLAETFQKTFETYYKKHQPQRGFSGTVSSRNLYMLKNTRPVAVFIELGNIRNFRDQQRFVLESNRAALAIWLADGILEDYKRYK